MFPGVFWATAFSESAVIALPSRLLRGTGRGSGISPNPPLLLRLLDSSAKSGLEGLSAVTFIFFSFLDAGRKENKSREIVDDPIVHLGENLTVCRCEKKAGKKFETDGRRVVVKSFRFR